MPTGFPVRLAILALGLGCAPAWAEGPAPVQDWSNVETVVVTAEAPGPALWHVVKGNSELWILPTVSPMPKDLSWDSKAVAELLKGSNQLLLPPHAGVGLLEGTWFLLTGLGSLEQPDGVTLESTLPEPLRGRFAATRTRIGEDADRYDEFLGGVAAIRLENDYWNFARLTVTEPQHAVERLASHADVDAKPVAEYPAMNVIRDVPKMSPAAHRACLDFALQDIETETAHAAAAAQAWAVGNLDGVKANYSEIKLDDCLQQNNAYAALRERAIRDMTNGMIAALAKPGKSFVVLPMGLFLRKGAVLDRLQAAGLTVSGP